jgi:hypothetical protein
MPESDYTPISRIVLRKGQNIELFNLKKHQFPII